ncbi:hypothetical protein E2C01_048146 [Portunus trituberculatus]|uniref:Uncharacterized protein n=1 Tax=Portunus trituberculatus TaxID=210409 RepID=A0A5B7G9S3_PORTR|nr:hypothetical protein [Portunus trituberculatus]
MPKGLPGWAFQVSFLSSQWATWRMEGQPLSEVTTFPTRGQLWAVWPKGKATESPSLPHLPLTNHFRDFRGYGLGSLKRQVLQLELQRLRDKSAMEEAPPSPGFYNQMCVVPNASGGFRLIVDLSILNNYVITNKFNIETFFYSKAYSACRHT